MSNDDHKYVPRNLKACDVVPYETYLELGDNALYVIDIDLLHSVDLICDHLQATVIVNDYRKGGKFQYRGYRPQSCNIGAQKSQHKTGHALDCTFYRDGKEMPAETVRREIMLNNDKFYSLITRMEHGVSWVHIDNKETTAGRIILFEA